MRYCPQIFVGRRSVILMMALMVLVRSGWSGSAIAQEGVTNRFGFSGPEIFPIDDAIGQLRSADLNGDGLEDLVIVNNSRSKINLLYNQTGQTNEAAVSSATRLELNELPADARFRIDSIASEKRISSLVVADLNNDKQADIGYYGEPKELILQYNEGTNGWSAPKRWPITDGLLNPNALVTGDLNGDGREDLLLLAENHIYWLTQGDNEQLNEPVRIPYSGTLQAIQVLDVQGDGKDDLLLVNWDSPNPFRFRLQQEEGQLGPEIHFTLPPIRAYTAGDLDADKKTEVITVAQKSGRAQVSHFRSTDAPVLLGDWKEGQFQILPLTRTSKAKRAMTWGDINEDGLPDLLVAEPESGQLNVYLQQEGGNLSAPKRFATLTGLSEIAVADWDKDEKPEIFVLSSDERQIGVTKLDDQGRLAFPDIFPLTGRPLAMAVGSMTANAPPVMASIQDEDGKRFLEIRQASGEVRRQQLSDSFKSNPSALAIHDLDQDGLSDVLVLIQYERIKVLRQVANQDFEEHDVAPPGGTIEQAWMSTADVDGDGKQELLLAQKNFLRAVVLQPVTLPGKEEKKTWTFSVKEQVNAVASNSRIVGATAIENGTNAIPSLFLLDAERKSLALSSRDESGIWQITREIRLPESNFNSLDSTRIGSDKANAVAFFGLNTVAWLPLEGSQWEFVELDGYETPIRDGHLTDVVTGDLNEDGRKDLVFLETAKSYLDVVAYEPPNSLVPANRWQVFEERTFRGRRSNMPEPREALVVDLTKDGKKDLAVVVHDRILVYPQE